VRALPFSSTATQKLALGHETELTFWTVSMSETADHGDPLYLMAFPLLSTATQKLALGHDTEGGEWESMFVGADHVPPALATFASTNTRVRLSADRTEHVDQTADGTGHVVLASRNDR